MQTGRKNNNKARQKTSARGCATDQGVKLLTALRSFVSHCCPVSCSLYCCTSHVRAPAMYEPRALLSRPSAMEQLRITSGAYMGVRGEQM